MPDDGSVPEFDGQEPVAPKPATNGAGSPAAGPVPGANGAPAGVPDELRRISAKRRVTKGEEDPLKDIVTRVYVDTESFIIYTAADEAGDAGRLRYILPDDYETARGYRKRLAPIAAQLAAVSDVVASMRGWWAARFPKLSQYTVLRERTLDLMARAMQQAFEGDCKTAQALLASAQKEVTKRRDSRNRMRYILANAISLCVILFIVFVERGGLQAGGLAALFSGPAPAGGEPSGDFRVIDVLAFGALGAFFAVSAAINRVKVSHAPISIWEMLYAGFVRVPIGVIAAAVVILLISGGWILSSVAPDYKIWAFYLFGFLAGFSEMFVPNALKQAEATATVQQPGAQDGAGR
jgi:hypothetical protein